MEEINEKTILKIFKIFKNIKFKKRYTIWYPIKFYAYTLSTYLLMCKVNKKTGIPKFKVIKINKSIKIQDFVDTSVINLLNADEQLKRVFNHIKY